MNVTRRIEKLREEMKRQGVGLTIVTDHENQFYFTDYKAIIYSRPILLAVSEDTVTLIVPGLEEDHSKAHAQADNICVYYEQPEKVERGSTHWHFLDMLLNKLPGGSKVGVEYGSMSLGMAGTIRDKGFELADMGGFIKRMRYIKDEEEIAMMVEAGKVVSKAMEVCLESAVSGMTEMDLDEIGNTVIMQEVSRRYPGATIDIFVMSPGGLARTNMPHVFSNTRPYDKDEIVLHSRQVGLNGYRAEIERTFFIGKPSQKQMDVFRVMTEAQQTMLDGIRPGMTAGEADALGRKVIQKAGLGEYSNHRCGHGIGLGLHEEPYLRFDNELVLEPGMSFSIEPGIYIPELGGFRHSDTVILTENGSRKITSCKRELEDLILSGTKGKV